MSTAYHTLDFIGGPFDGFEFASPRNPDDEFLFIPVAGSTDLRLNTAALAKGKSPTSLAIYELRTSPRGWSYCFLCADSAMRVEQTKMKHRR